MKPFAISMIVAALALGAVGAVNASVWTDVDAYNVLLTAGGNPSSVQGTFNIVNDGFTPGVDTVTSAVFTVFAYDDSLFDGPEAMNVTLDNVTVGSQIDVNLILYQQFPVSAQLIGDINADGTLSYTITATQGDFFLSLAELSATGTQGQDAPEPATIVIWSLLGRRKLVWYEGVAPPRYRPSPLVARDPSGDPRYHRQAVSRSLSKSEGRTRRILSLPPGSAARRHTLAFLSRYPRKPIASGRCDEWPASGRLD